jgi:hypothetical protein
MNLYKIVRYDNIKVGIDAIFVTNIVIIPIKIHCKDVINTVSIIVFPVEKYPRFDCIVPISFIFIKFCKLLNPELYEYGFVCNISFIGFDENGSTVILFDICL